MHALSAARTADQLGPCRSVYTLHVSIANQALDIPLAPKGLNASTETTALLHKRTHPCFQSTSHPPYPPSLYLAWLQEVKISTLCTTVYTALLNAVAARLDMLACTWGTLHTAC
jgi:hypothetical protein